MNPEDSTESSPDERELISALADGQLRGAQFARVVDLVCQDQDARATWQAYHVVGDVMRSSELARGARHVDDAAFVARFRDRLRLNADTVTSPGSTVGLPENSKMIANYVPLTGTTESFHSKSGVSNDSSFRWKLLAGVASLAAVAAVGWSLVGQVATPVGGAQLAQGQKPASVQAGTAVPSASPQSPVALAEPPAMIRDPHLDALLAAHRQFGGTSALQMPAGFLRNATFEGAPR